MNASSTSINIAHIGLGRIGVGHASALLADPRVNLFVANRTHAKAEAFAAEHDCQAITIDDIFAEGSPIEAVVIASSTDTHEPLIIRASQAGLPFFCEKPLAADMEGMQRVAAELSRSGVRHHIGFNRRFDPGYIGARKAIANGELGLVTRIAMVSSDATPPPPEFIPTSGGMFVDMAVHDFDILRWVTGQEVEWIIANGAARGGEVFSDYNDVDEATCVMQLTDKTLVTQHLSRQNGAGYDIRMEIFGQKSMRAVGYYPKAPLVSLEEDGTYPIQEPYPTFDKRFEKVFIKELGGFVDFVMSDAPSACTYEDAMEATYLALAANKSLAEDRKVYISEVKG